MDLTKSNARGYWHTDAHVGDLVNLTPWFSFVEDERDRASFVPVFIRLGINDSGRHVCTGLIIGDLDQSGWGPREINAATLRSVSIPELIAFALRTGEIPDAYGEAVRELLAAAPSTVTHPGRAGYQDDHYVSIAAMYRRALVESPTAPTQWLAETLHQSPPTLRRWLKEARRRGHLGPARPGQPGEGNSHD
ncbi:hypothetical protein [Jatrophihabitans sp.]|uniref:hypothetical protein n=1 Tax=Jatrophihabitans sp. TaxID=1932789 RepID=UPI0030C68F11